MTEQEIKDNNELIALFMGLKTELVEIDREFDEPIYKVYSDTHLFFERFRINDISLEQGFNRDNPLTYFYKFIKLKYHSDWNWLMPVLEKICRLKIGDGIITVEYTYPRTFGMLNEETGKIMVRLNGHQLFEADTLIEATWLAVVDFIKWRNENE